MARGKNTNPPDNMECSFCGRGASDGAAVVPGPNGANICEECARMVTEIFDDIRKRGGSGDVSASAGTARGPAAAAKKPPAPIKAPPAREIKEFLDRYIIGHDETKKTLAVAVHNHYRRLEAKLAGKTDERFSDVEIEKSNILLVGPTGCGKTLFARTLAKLLKVPFAIGDATTLTEAGYVGEDVENVVRYLWQNAGGDLEQTRRGIIYIDEIDKIASRTDNVSITRDVSGEGVQQALLKILEGTVCRFPPKGGRKHPDQEYVEVDTSDILFIVGGAFVGLERIVAERNGRGNVGFGGDSKPSAPDGIRPEDLVKFGLIPEFTGRLPVISQMKELDEDALVRVLTEPKNCLVDQYRKLLAMDGVELEFEPEALRALAKDAISRRTGARGLRASMERVMTDIMYEAPGKGSKKVVITADAVRGAM